jgi:hypothetical protein
VVICAEGYHVFDADPRTLAWAQAAHRVALDLVAQPEVRAPNLRHQATWFVGVDALPNATDGSINGAVLAGDWGGHVDAPSSWHRAQLSIVYPGYPGQDPDESDANHRYRINRFAAHVDGLLPIGPDRRRFLKEPHAFILGLSLNVSDAAPLMVWPGSHQIMGAAFRSAMIGHDPTGIDITDIYQSARREVFDTITPIAIRARPGQAMLLHRHLLHGVAPWQDGDSAPPEGRMIAYFRPQFGAEDWLRED